VSTPGQQKKSPAGRFLNHPLPRDADRMEQGEPAMIKVHIRRPTSEEKQEALMKLINRLRSTIAGRPGYLSSETLKRVDPPGEILVVSKWQSFFYWERWYASQERMDIQKRIDDLLESETRYEIYEYE
jgi:heme-degrading monooxygenase HmoA